jgi:hypothetical protein
VKERVSVLKGKTYNCTSYFAPIMTSGGKASVHASVSLGCCSSIDADAIITSKVSEQCGFCDLVKLTKYSFKSIHGPDTSILLGYILGDTEPKWIHFVISFQLGMHLFIFIFYNLLVNANFPKGRHS